MPISSPPKHFQLNMMETLSCLHELIGAKGIRFVIHADGFVQDQISGLLGDHYDGHVGVAADNARHHRGVDDPQTGNSVDAQAVVDDSLIITSHAAGTDRMIIRLGPKL